MHLYLFYKRSAGGGGIGGSNGVEVLKVEDVAAAAVAQYIVYYNHVRVRPIPSKMYVSCSNRARHSGYPTAACRQIFYQVGR